MKKSTQCIMLVICLMLSLISVQTQPEYASAAATPKLSKTKITFDDMDDYRLVTIKNVKSSNIKKVIRSSQNIKVVDTDKGNAKNNFIVTPVGPGGPTKVIITLKLKKAINKKKTYKFSLTVTVKGVVATPTPSIDPSASPSATPSASPTAKPADPLTGEEKTVYDKLIALKTKYPEDMSWPNTSSYKWYAYYYQGNPASSTGTPITLDMSGSAALSATLSDAVFGTGVHDLKVAVPNPGKKVDNPNPDTIRVGDVIKYWPDTKGYRVSIVIGKNSDQLLLVESSYDEKVTWEAWIPKTTKIDTVYSRYQTAAPSPSPKVSPSPSALPQIVPYRMAIQTESELPMQTAKD